MKVGIAGTGKIVREFLNMQKDRERIEVTALVCRPQSEKTGRELAEQRYHRFRQIGTTEKE